MKKTIQSATKIRIYPNKDQKILLSKHFGAKRFVYNFFLDKRTKLYKEEEKSISLYETSRLLTQLKKEEQYEWLNEIDSQSSKAALKDLDVSFKNFFKKRARYPKFKSRYDNYHSYRTTQCISVDSENKRLKVPKLDPIKFRGNIKDGLKKINSCTISRTPSNKYYAVIQGEFEIDILPSTGELIGLDIGIREFAVDSNGKSYENPKFLDKSIKKLQFLSRQLSKKKKGSKNREKARKKLAIQHEKISFKRNDHLHKVSQDIIKNNQIMFMEDFDIKEMMKQPWMARKIGDVSWGKFKDYLKYKSENNDRKLVLIDRFFASNRTCSSCGHVNETINLTKDYHFKCESCDVFHSKTINSAKNVLKEGIKILKDEPVAQTHSS